jgi:hypothetical protein
MGIAGYVSVCVQLYCVSFHCLSLHVSAYMAILKCVGYFYFHMLEGFAFFFNFFRVVTLCILPFVSFPLFSFVIFVAFCCFQQKFVKCNNDLYKRATNAIMYSNPAYSRSSMLQYYIS